MHEINIESPVGTHTYNKSYDPTDELSPSEGQFKTWKKPVSVITRNKNTYILSFYLMQGLKFYV